MEGRSARPMVGDHCLVDLPRDPGALGMAQEDRPGAGERAAQRRFVGAGERAFAQIGGEALVEGVDPRGRPYYWFGLEDVEHTPDHGTDLEAVGDGYIAVTPLQLDLTHHASLGTLAERYAG